MRINEYIFPESVPDNVRWHEGAEGIDGYGEGKEAVCTKAGLVVSGITITRCKQLMRKYGGHAYTRHIERDGSEFGTTEIRLKGNNSSHAYNHHL